MSERSALKEELAETDDAFRRLLDEHQDSERRLDQLCRKSLRSPEDEIEEKRIKLHKLRLKDQMEEMLRMRSAATASAV